METELKKNADEAHQRLGDSNHLESIPGIGVATAAVLTAKMVDCQRFALVSYFGVFPRIMLFGRRQAGTTQARPIEAHVTQGQRPGPPVPVERGP